MASLATALTATKTQYSNELTYMPGMAPISANDPSLEKGGMQVTSFIFSTTNNILCSDKKMSYITHTRMSQPSIIRVVDHAFNFNGH